MAEAVKGVKGVKLARYDLIPPEATWMEALVYGVGANKYADRNWEAGFQWGSSIAALERHLQLYKAGEDIEPEYGLPHMAHVRWHTGVLLSFYLRNAGIDDRSKFADVDVMQAELLNPEEIVAAKAAGSPTGPTSIVDPPKIPGPPGIIKSPFGTGQTTAPKDQKYTTMNATHTEAERVVA